MAYVDLNPIRAAMAKTPEESDYTSIQKRINSKDDSFLVDLGINDSDIAFSFNDYCELVDASGRAIRSDKKGFIDDSLSPILTRLELDDVTWLYELNNFQTKGKKAFGTIVAERVADVIMLLFITGIAFFLQTELLASYLFKDDKESTLISKVFFFIVLPAISYFTYTVLKKSKNSFLLKIFSFINGLMDGVKSIKKMEKKWQFIFHTVFIWIMYVLMFYTTTFALPETTNLPFAAIIVGFVVGGFSMALTNGGLGTYPVFVASALILYHVDDNPARAFGWIMWTAQTLMVIVFGGISFLLIPIYNKYQK